MRLPNAVLLSAAIALASYLETLQVHALGGDEADAFVGRSLRSDTTSGTHNEERFIPEVMASLKRFRVKLSSAHTAAGTAKKALSDDTAIVNQKIWRALKDLNDHLGDLMKQEKISSVGELLNHPAVYRSLKEAVQSRNKKEGNKISVRPIQVLLQRFEVKEIKPAIKKAVESSDNNVKTLGKELKNRFETELKIIRMSKDFIQKPKIAK
uniref:RxLR effector protein n=1 Tax=Peronospora matthiolae TaxID=2874970 RepID=A0AAV1TNG5_9STRA